MSQLDTCTVARITSLAPTNPNQALAAQQLMHSVKEAQTDILMIFDSRCSREGPKVPGLDPRMGTHPPQSFWARYQQ